MFGNGAQLYTTIDNNTSSTGTMLRVYKSIMMDLPYQRLGYLFCTTNILAAFKGAIRVHVVDYGILYGFHWACLIKELANQQKGPPHLRITGICTF
jgi:hypothetical protein